MGCSSVYAAMNSRILSAISVSIDIFPPFVFCNAYISYVISLIWSIDVQYEDRCICVWSSDHPTAKSMTSAYLKIRHLGQSNVRTFGCF